MMQKLFKQFDTAVSVQADKFKSTPYWQRFEEFINQVNEDQIFLVKYAVIAIIIFVPLTIVMTVSGINSALKKDIDVRLKTLGASQEITDYNQAFMQKGFEAMTTSRVESEQDIIQRLSQIAGQAGLAPTALQTSNYERIPGEGPEVTTTGIKIKFSALSSQQIINLLSILSDQDKAIFKQVRIDKNAQNSLDGILGISYLHRTFGSGQ